MQLSLLAVFYRGVERGRELRVHAGMRVHAGTLQARQVIRDGHVDRDGGIHVEKNYHQSSRHCTAAVSEDFLCHSVPRCLFVGCEERYSCAAAVVNCAMRALDFARVRAVRRRCSAPDDDQGRSHGLCCICRCRKIRRTQHAQGVRCRRRGGRQASLQCFFSRVAAAQSRGLQFNRASYWPVIGSQLKEL